MREEPPRLQRRVNDQAFSLAREWRMLHRAATLVALLTSPALFALLFWTYDWALPWALLGAFAGVIIFRGGVDVIAHKLIPSPALYGAESDLKQQDVISRRRLWYWRHKFKVWIWIAVLVLIALTITALVSGSSLFEAPGEFMTIVPFLLIRALPYVIMLPLLFLVNFLILFG